MIKIAFCDDDLSVLKELSILMDRYRVERNQDITYAAFHSPLELLAEVERGTELDIIFLDVLMPGQNGISTAKEIRKYDTLVKIIYLTSSAEYAVDSYSVGAYFYQLKPIWQESFYRMMDSVLSECRRNEEKSLILRSKSGITRMDLDKLQYCEVMGRTLLFHRQDGVVLDSAEDWMICANSSRIMIALSAATGLILLIWHMCRIFPVRPSQCAMVLRSRSHMENIRN